MKTIEQCFTVSYRYPVVFCNDVFAPSCGLLADLLALDPYAPQPHRVLIAMDRGVDRTHPDLRMKITAWLKAHEETVTLAAPIEFLPGNEFVKKHDTLTEKLIKLTYQVHFGRKDTFIAIGGGAVQDVVGYVAGLVHRGCHVIRVNTTTLAQADAGVGVKNGVDYAACKNYLGSFAPPLAVVNDASFLPTLSDKDWRNGIAEAVKVAVIKDIDFLKWLEEHADDLRMRDLPTMTAMIERTAELHLEHIAKGGDPFERGTARPLDFGHWSAHRLEALSCYQLSHGEAVSIGIALDMVYAQGQGLVDEGECNRVIGILRTCGLPVWCDELLLCGSDGRLGVLEGLHQFREHLGGELCVTLPSRLGHKTEVHEMDAGAIAEAVRTLHRKYA